MIKGLYTDWSAVLQLAWRYNYDVMAAMRRRVASLREAGANLIWWTNLPNDAAILSAILQECGPDLRCVFGSGFWYAYENKDGFPQILALHEAGVRPYAWSIGDETPPAAFEMLASIDARCRRRGIPTTMVQMPEYFDATPVKAVRDVYPFFVSGPGASTKA